jgi:hypothetical protein
VSAGPDLPAYWHTYEHLVDELRWLDLLIRLRNPALHSESAPQSQASRAIYITPAEFESLLDEGEEPKAVDAATAERRTQLRQLRADIDGRVARSEREGVFLALPQLERLFRLSSFERQVIVICLAPELRRRYDRLYAYLQDDITRKRPSVDLTLQLLCDAEDQRWSARHLLSEGATLLRTGLLQKADDPHSLSGSTGLAQFLALDPRICEFLLGSAQIEARLASIVQFHHPASDAASIEAAAITGVWSLVQHHLASDGRGERKLVLHFHGPYGVGKLELASHLCRQLGSLLLIVDAEMLLARGPEGESLLRLAFREGLLQQAFLYVERADALLQHAARPLLQALRTSIAEFGSLVFLSGEARWAHEQAFANCLFHSLELPLPDVRARAVLWARCLAGQTSDPISQAAELAAQFRLTPGQIRAAVALAENRRVMNPERRTVTAADLAAACREQSNHKLSELAAKIEPHCGWSDIVLPEEKLAHLREICSQVRHRHLVFGSWGFGRKLGRGKGLSALFSGPSGTGKTMAAEVMAADLELDIYKVDLAGVVSKYIGETEKNLARIFAEAETSNAILFFDEADALFGKRTDVADAHDRYANIETSYLLQKMEEYEGIVILATNLSQNMDEAFTRRIRFIVEFPFPDEANRLRIWQAHLPAEAPVAPDIDCKYLARKFHVAGGNIRNIVLHAAFLAVADGGAIALRHIIHGARREFEKMGKLWNDDIVAARPALELSAPTQNLTRIAAAG